MTNDTAGSLREELEHLRQSRDELRVQLNLARKEARDRYQAAEKHWHELEARLKVVAKESKSSLADIGDAGKLLLTEIREAYKHVRQLL